MKEEDLRLGNDVEFDAGLVSFSVTLVLSLVTAIGRPPKLSNRLSLTNDHPSNSLENGLT